MPERDQQSRMTIHHCLLLQHLLFFVLLKIELGGACASQALIHLVHLEKSGHNFVPLGAFLTEEDLFGSDWIYEWADCLHLDQGNHKPKSSTIAGVMLRDKTYIGKA